MAEVAAIGTVDISGEGVVAQTDDIARLVAILVRQHQGGLAETMRYTAFGTGRDSLGQLAKACGATREQVQAWEAALVAPTTQQGLAWLAFLYASQPAPFVPNRPEREADARWHSPEPA